MKTVIKPMPVEFRHIRAFHAVANALSFRKASEHLNIAQPALSRTIKDLEEILQIKLFERTTRMTRLTEPGRIFLKHTSPLLSGLDYAIDRAQRANRGVTGELRVGFNDFAINGLLPQIVRQFRHDFPQVEVNLIDSTTTTSVDRVLDEDFDIAFITGQGIWPEFDHLIMREEQVVCVLPVAHPLARYESVSIADLVNEPFIMGRWESWKSYNRVIRDICVKQGFAPNVIQEAEHSDGIIGLVAASMGIALHVRSTWIEAMEGIVIVELNDVMPRVQTSAIWRKDRSPNAHTLENFINVVQQCINEEDQYK